MSCKDCKWNNSGLCEKFGYLVDDDDDTCKIIELNEDKES